MSADPRAGQKAPKELLINVPRLVAAYYTDTPDPADASQAVSFGTSGHRGTSLEGTFNEAHIVATSQAIVEYRREQGIAGPLFVGMDTHALSEPAMRSAVEVFAANDVHVVLPHDLGFVPTPVISHAILTHNAAESSRADGIVITPSHNPPADGGFKYNPPHGGPAGTDETAWIERRANGLLREWERIRRIPFARALRSEHVMRRDFIRPYVNDLGNVVDMERIREAGIRIGADPMGGSGIHFLGPIAERYGLDLTVVNDAVDPTLAFMTLDAGGNIRVDCSSPYAMAGLIGLKDRFDIAFGNDPDFDRHGIITPTGLMNPNHYLAVSIDYLFRNRAEWGPQAAVGKTLVRSEEHTSELQSRGRTV